MDGGEGWLKKYIYTGLGNSEIACYIVECKPNEFRLLNYWSSPHTEN